MILTIAIKLLFNINCLKHDCHNDNRDKIITTKILVLRKVLRHMPIKDNEISFGEKNVVKFPLYLLFLHSTKYYWACTKVQVICSG